MKITLATDEGYILTIYEEVEQRLTTKQATTELATEIATAVKGAVTLGLH
jgi:hypothetical protein